MGAYAGLVSFVGHSFTRIVIADFPHKNPKNRALLVAWHFHGLQDVIAAVFNTCVVPFPVPFHLLVVLPALIMYWAIDSHTSVWWERKLLGSDTPQLAQQRLQRMLPVRKSGGQEPEAVEEYEQRPRRVAKKSTAMPWESAWPWILSPCVERERSCRTCT